jgi:hypothetical protein
VGEDLAAVLRDIAFANKKFLDLQSAWGGVEGQDSLQKTG